MVTTGKIVKNERIKAHITQRELAKGICAFQLIDKLERDGCGMDKLTFELLIQRLGKCPDHLEYVLSIEEYQKLEKRNQIETCILQGKREAAEAALEEYYAQSDQKNHVQEMYYHRMKAALLARYHKNEDEVKEALFHIQRAMEETIPDWEKNLWEEMLLSEWEIENILAYAKILFLLDTEDSRKKGCDCLEKCYQLIEDKKSNREIQSHLLPKCIYLMACYYDDEFDQQVLLERCLTAIELLRDYGVIYLLKPLLEESIRIATNTGRTELTEKWQLYCDAIGDVYQQFAQKMVQDSIFFHWHQCEYHLDFELIKGERLNQNKTQEELIEDVFSTVVSLSNLENGKSSPGIKKFDALMKNLNIEKSKYSGVAITESFEDLDWIQEVRRKQNCGEFQEVIEMIDAKEKLQDSFVENNKRILLAYRIISLINLDQEKAKSLKEDLFEEINRTYPLDKEEYHRKPFYAEVDMIITYLSVERTTNPEHAMQIYKKLLAVYRSSRLDVKYCYRSFGAVITNYVMDEGRSDIYHDVEEQFYEGVSYCVKCGKGSAICLLYWGLATSKQKKDPLDKDLFWGSYIFAELVKNQMSEVIHQAYIKSIRSHE